MVSFLTSALLQVLHGRVIHKECRVSTFTPEIHDETWARIRPLRRIDESREWLPVRWFQTCFFSPPPLNNPIDNYRLYFLSGGSTPRSRAAGSNGPGAGLVDDAGTEVQGPHGPGVKRAPSSNNKKGLFMMEPRKILGLNMVSASKLTKRETINDWIRLKLQRAITEISLVAVFIPCWSVLQPQFAVAIFKMATKVLKIARVTILVEFKKRFFVTKSPTRCSWWGTRHVLRSTTVVQKYRLNFRTLLNGCFGLTLVLWMTGSYHIWWATCWFWRSFG